MAAVALPLLALLALLAAGAAPAARAQASASPAPSAGGGPDNVLLTHRLLLLTTDKHDSWATDFLKKISLGYGAPLEVLVLDDAAPADLASYLWEAPPAAAGAAVGAAPAGRFSGFVMHPDVESLGHLTRQQLLDLQDYQRRTGARALKFGAEPASLGLAAGACSRDPGDMTFTSTAPFGISGVRPGAVLSAAGVWRCPAVDAAGSGTCCANPSDGGAPVCSQCQSGAVLRVSAPATGAAAAATANATGTLPAPSSQVAAVLTNHVDGRQALSFLLDCNQDSTACWALGHQGLAWAMQNIIPGRRRALLSLQVDDLFLSTDGPSGGSYRATPADLRALAAWQQQMSARLPPGSDVRAEMAFNGNGVLLTACAADAVTNAPECFQTDAYRALNCTCYGKAMAACPADANWYCRSCTKDWKRVRGSAGITYTPPPDTSRWSAERFAAGDDLYRALTSDPSLADAFFWSSHTFSHQMLDNVTLEGARLQLDLNKAIAGEAFLGLSQRVGFSHSAMVTPAISGLFNGDALSAIAAAGFSTVVGDNTWPQLVNQGNPHHMLYTSDAVNGYPSDPGSFAIAIMPRWSTGIGYSASTAQEALDIYNSEVSASDTAASLDDLLTSEADRVLREALLALRYDGHMFHQANLRTAGSGAGSGAAGSLLARWAEAVLSRLTALVDWPVRSLKLDELAQLHLNREARDACGLTYRLNVSRSAERVASVAFSASGAPPGGGECAAPLMLRGGVMLEDGRGGRAGVSTQDGVRTLLARVPGGGSAAYAVSGNLPWILPPAPAAG